MPNGNSPAAYSTARSVLRGAVGKVPTRQLARRLPYFIILHRDPAVIQQCQSLVTEWLQQLGLDLHPAKTRIAHTLLPEDGKAGFDFLGFEVRQYPVSRYNAKRGYKTLIKPSRTAVKRHYAQLGAIIRKNQAARQEILIEQLNPLVVGWSRYYSAVVSKAIFQCLDNLLYLRLARWARYRHPHKAAIPGARKRGSVAGCWWPELLRLSGYPREGTLVYWPDAPVKEINL